MLTTQSSTYQKAFSNYLRHGTPIERSLKAETERSTHYIWHTAGDDKVRPSHAANNGQIFAWDNPPATGHPGSAINCRCTTEPYYGFTDKPLEPVYPEFALIPLLRVSRGAIALAARVVRRVQDQELTNEIEGFTDHGKIRSVERRISSQDAEEAIISAKETGNFSIERGKYGTPQIHYRGDNGITVVVETSGRNAEKVITFWYNQ